MTLTMTVGFKCKTGKVGSQVCSVEHSGRTTPSYWAAKVVSKVNNRHLMVYPATCSNSVLLRPCTCLQFNIMLNHTASFLVIHIYGMSMFHALLSICNTNFNSECCVLSGISLWGVEKKEKKNDVSIYT